MKLNELRDNPGARKDRIRVGRGIGSGKGKTSGSGGKGQTARKGASIRAGFEGGQMPFYRRIPKLGFTSRKRVLGTNRYVVVNLSDLESFDSGATVDAAALAAKGFQKSLARQAGVKVLGTGDLTKKLTVKVDAISASAKSKIESLGGTVEILKKAETKEK